MGICCDRGGGIDKGTRNLSIREHASTSTTMAAEWSVGGMEVAAETGSKPTSAGLGLVVGELAFRRKRALSRQRAGLAVTHSARSFEVARWRSARKKKKKRGTRFGIPVQTAVGPAENLSMEGVPSAHSEDWGRIVGGLRGEYAHTLAPTFPTHRGVERRGTIEGPNAVINCGIAVPILKTTILGIAIREIVGALNSTHLSCTQLFSKGRDIYGAVRLNSPKYHPGPVQ